MENEIMVSVCCLAYNHEPYIRECLEGFINQKTNFKYEVLIHDDASTDNTADIIREYEAKYPDIIKPIYQTENQHTKRVHISAKYQYPRVKGKYVALCEGDDYWTDDTKLQQQFEMMEQHPEAAFCTHIVQSVNEQGESLNERFPNKPMPEFLKADEFTALILHENSYPFHTSSYFFPSHVLQDVILDNVEFFYLAPVGDLPLQMYLSTKGNLCFIDKTMSCYRRNTVGSWSSRINSNPDVKINYRKRMIDTLKSFNRYTDGEFSEQITQEILFHEFHLHLLENNYKALLEKKYRNLFKTKLSTKEKIYYFAGAKLPFLFKTYTKYLNRGQ